MRRAQPSSSIGVSNPGALGAEDAEEVNDDLPANSSALLIAFENLWAARIVDALQDADGVVIDSIRIPVDVVDSRARRRLDSATSRSRGNDMGLLRMAARTAVVAGTATAVSGRVARRQAARYDQQDAQQYAQEPQQYAPQPQHMRRSRRWRKTTRPHSCRS